MNDRLDLSVIIPNLNDAVALRMALASAAALAPREVIVCDGGSRDDSQAVAEGFGARWVDSPPGRGKQLRRGANVASGEVFLFLHADCQIAPQAAEQMRLALENSKVKGGAFCQSAPNAGWRLKLVLWGNEQRVRWQGLAYGDQAIFVRADFYRQLGGFPEWPLLEDVAFMQAFRRRSKPVLLDGPVTVDARRWRRHGLIRQTLRNWIIMAAYRLGVSPRTLATWYRRHDL